MSSLLDPHSKHGKKGEHQSTLEKGEEHVRRGSHSVKRRVVFAFLAILVLLVMVVLLFLLPNTRHDKKDQTTQMLTSSDADNIGSPNSDYTTINGADISSNATETNIPEKSYSERIEIPGDIADKMLEVQIKNQDNQSGQYNADLAKLKSKSRQTYVSRKENGKPTVKITAKKRKTEKRLKFKELPLYEVIENNHYTIQLTGSSTKKNLLKYVKEHKIENYQIYETNRKDDIWYIVVKGNYPTYSDAKSALDSLPKKLKNNSPWVRSGKSLHKNKH